MQQRIDAVAPIVHEHMEEAQQAQQQAHPAQPREFQPGDRVLVLVPTTTCKFLATWQGPYTPPSNLNSISAHSISDQLLHFLLTLQGSILAHSILDQLLQPSSATPF
ncbi:hypothetical protein SRHO_G00226430 [Serrasalmus rhombeus]